MQKSERRPFSMATPTGGMKMAAMILRISLQENLLLDYAHHAAKQDSTRVCFRCV